MRRQGRTVTVGSGQWRGRVLAYPDDAAIRPTMQRTKHSLFSSIGPRLRGAVFADLFAGAGAVGIEALSLGAGRVHFVEADRGAAAALRANLAACHAEPARFVLHEERVSAVLARRPCPLADAEIVFADPPYDADAAGEFLRHLSRDLFPALELAVVEHRTKSPVCAPVGLVVERERRFGETTLTYFVPA